MSNSSSSSGVKGTGVRIPETEIRKDTEAIPLLPKQEDLTGDIFCDGECFIIPMSSRSRVLELATGQLYELRQVDGAPQGTLERREMGIVGERLVEAALRIYEECSKINNA